MVHRQTPSQASFRGHSSGGGRALIENVDDSELMQAMNGQGMKGESFGGSKDSSYKGPEAPQNYGFTSVVADATKAANGVIKQCAEGFMSYLNGSRSHPVCGMMDDRRHRLKNLAKDAAKGATAMFGQKEWGQQILNTEDGQFITGNLKKKNRMQLVENKNGQKAQQQQQGGAQGGGGGKQASVMLVALDGSEPHLLAQAVRNEEGKLVIRSKSGVEFEVEEFINRPAARAGNGGGAAGPSGGGQQGAQGDSKPTGQKTLHKEETDVYVEQNGTDTVSRHGEGYSSQKTGSDSTIHWEKDKKKSSQVTELHTHIRFKDNWYWNDKDGNYFMPPPLVKKDPHCKEG